MYEQTEQAADIAVVTFCWGDKFERRHVNALRAAVAANLRVPHRFVCVTDQPQDCETVPMWESPVDVPHRPRNFHRLKLFDSDTQAQLGARIVQIDLDAVIVDDLTPLVTCAEPFRIMVGTAIGRGMMCSPYNGSMWVHDIGARQHFWDRIVAEGAGALDRITMPGGGRIIGSDQAWIAHCSPTEATFAASDGVHQYRIVGGRPPSDARAVFFAGHQQPWDAGVASESPRLHAMWTCYAADRVQPWTAHDGGRCLLIGVGETVWDDVREALAEGGMDGIVAMPESAITITHRRVDGVALDFDAAERKARLLGFDDFVRCGREYAYPQPRNIRTGRGSSIAI